MLKKICLIVYSILILISLLFVIKDAYSKDVSSLGKVKEYGVYFYEPTYILPYYSTMNPYNEVYKGYTPNGQDIMQDEFKANISLLIPVFLNMFGTGVSLEGSYTQTSYWQFYSKSQFFRSTDYMAALFISDCTKGGWCTSDGISHQSNGEGGSLERSWNRVFSEISYSSENFLFSGRVWKLVFTKYSSDRHNPDIQKYLGNSEFILAYRKNKQEISIRVRNLIRSLAKRGSVEVGYQFPIYSTIKGYITLFSGYGQSLLEYNHYTNSIGVGIIMSNWL